MPNNDGNIINLRGEDEIEPDFKIKSFESDEVSAEPVDVEAKSTDIVRVNFVRFVNLVANKDYEEILDKHENENIFIKADLLAELADVPQETDEKKVSGIFVLGLVVGLLLAWLLFKS